jgi:SagB-type dehydrogenase family enzyme
MTAKEEIERLVGSLSEYECAHLLDGFRRVSAGERFWEGEISTLYNEHVKTRSFDAFNGGGHAVPAPPETSDGVFAPVPIVKPAAGIARVPLPPPGALTAPIGALLEHRRSRRAYTGASISSEVLSTVLHGACGVTGSMPGYGYKHLPLRTFPSSGGLQSPEIYLSVQAVDGVAPGLYHFQAQARALDLLRPGSHGGTLKSLALDQECLATAAVVVLITGCFERLRWKYGERAYKYMCIDIGYVGQNLYLVAEALGLGACAIAGFLDDGVERFLALDNPSEIPLLLTSVGVRSGD